jgi:acyl-CoA synthetase (NDP forming)
VASAANPVDMIASASPELYERATRALLADPCIDAVLVVFVPPIVTSAHDVAEAIVRAADQMRAEGRMKPLASCFLGRHGVTEGLRSLHEGHIPSYTFPENAAIALAHAARYGAWRAEPDGRVPRFTGIAFGAARDAIASARTRGERLLDPLATAAVLSAYHIAMPSACVARTREEAERAAHALEFPLVAKLVAPTITHKSDVGGVIMDIETPRAAAAAFDTVRARLSDRDRAHEMTGVLLQEMVRGGIETIVGAAADPLFGPVLMFGMGGVSVEVMRDVAFRVHPLTDRDARELVRGVRGARMLDGFRGAPPGDVAALEEVILRISQLVGDHPEVAEIEINPLVVLAPGDGCIALDARIILA